VILEPRSCVYVGRSPTDQSFMYLGYLIFAGALISIIVNLSLNTDTIIGLDLGHAAVLVCFRLG